MQSSRGSLGDLTRYDQVWTVKNYRVFTPKVLPIDELRLRPDGACYYAWLIPRPANSIHTKIGS